MFDTIKNVIIDNGFYLELILAYIPFVLLLKRRKMFWLRLTGCLVAGFLLCYFTPQFWWELGQVSEEVYFIWPPLIYSMARYAVIFLATIGFLFICFDCKIFNGIFCGVAAYATQHGAYKLTTVSEFFINNYASMHTWLNYLFYWAAVITVYGLVYILFARRLRQEENFKFDNKKLIFTSLALIMITVVLSFLGQVSANMFNRILVETPIFVVIALFSVTTSFLVLSNLFDNANNKKMEAENQMIRSLWARDRSQYQMAKQNIELMNVKYHDLKHQLKTVNMDEDVRKEIEEVVNVYSSMVRTKNESLDVVLTEKAQMCDKHGIKLACIADGESISHIKPTDIYSLFGNSIDNAIECLSGVDDPDKKVINVLLEKTGSMVYIQIENYLPIRLELKNGLPQTTKGNTAYHGFGLKSIRMIAEKYKGNMMVSADNEIFSLMVLLPAK